jgi:hypothetical protein
MARLAHAADRDVDQPRLLREQFLRTQAQPLHRSRPEILDEHVGLSDEFPENLDACLLLMSTASDRLPRLEEMNSAENSPPLSMGARLRRVMSPRSARS